MGEILRHAEIFRNTHRLAGPLRPAEKFTYLELGNFLTDVSQFRDPFAHLSAKHNVWRAASEEDPLSYIPILGIFLNDIALDALDVDVWVDDMLGQAEPADKRYGLLAAYFEQVVLAITHLIFADDIPLKQAARMFLPEDLAALEPLPAAEVTRVFRWAFTQYYPHEHLDFPPYPPDPEQRKRHALYQRRGTGLIAYLEVDIQYIAEGLSRLEAEWKQKAKLPPEHPERVDVLVKLGHLLHAVEDYFYHSNYVELNLWNDLRRTRPSRETEADFKRWFAENALTRYRVYSGYDPGYNASALGDETHPGFTRWRRKLMRRLRMTEYGKRGGVSKEGSISGLEMIYTGGFEANDMFHTMAGALEGLEALFHRYDENANWIPAELRQKLKLRDSRVLSESELALIRALFNAEHRTRMVEDAKFKKEQVALHKQQLQDGIYPKGIRMFFEKGLINAAGRDALLAAFDIDQKLEDYGSLTPGIGGFLINFLTLAQKALNESRRKSYQLDRRDMGKPGEGAVLDERSDNGASGETVGTHTLLAKDTPKSQPLYEDANALAKFASLAAATILMNSVNDLPDPNIGQDWEAILRHYLRFPRALPGMWEQQVLEHVRNTGENPRFDQIADAPRYPPLTLTPGGRMEALRAGKKRQELEALYIALEKKADSYMLLNIIPG